MGEAELRRLLARVRDGSLGVDAALARLRDLPYEDLGFARIDHHRSLRVGFPEVVFAQGKTPAQVAAIMTGLARHNPVVFATRADAGQFDAVRAVLPAARFYAEARIIAHGEPCPPHPNARPVVVCAAGTADLPVAEEAALSAELAGSRVERLYDVGVAGIHRLLAHRASLAEAGAIVVAAGMEGALPSVVAGLAGCPIVAVPTSVGYGASFGGLAALLAMLNSCAVGVAVVNIDNGFGAGIYAHMIARRQAHPPREPSDDGQVAGSGGEHGSGSSSA